jgi:zinc transporter ZupT
VVPLFARRPLPDTWIGWAMAVAAGLMLGAAYALFTAGFRTGTALAGAGGAGAGIAFVALTQVLFTTTDAGPESGHQRVLIDLLHAAPEGIAIGAALTVSPAFGAFLALALGVHNVPEATVFATALVARGVRRRTAAMLAVLGNFNQVLFAVVGP